MPEGDTIYRSAAVLRRALVGETIQATACHNPRCERPLPDDQLVGQTCVAIEARGKHLLMHLNGGAAIHSHMGMTGSWHLYRPGEPWQKPTNYASLALQFNEFLAVCFTPHTLELLSTDALEHHSQLCQLGPDILDESFNPETAVVRFGRHGSVPLGIAIMNQRIVCGIGNVYKSELLFLERLDPFGAVESFTFEQLQRLLAQSRRLMLRNLDGRPRQTRFDGGGRLWVYGRNGQPCHRCASPIRMRRQGDAGRSTYWCTRCQQTAAS